MKYRHGGLMGKEEVILILTALSFGLMGIIAHLLTVAQFR